MNGSINVDQVITLELHGGTYDWKSTGNHSPGHCIALEANQPCDVTFKIKGAFNYPSVHLVPGSQQPLIPKGKKPTAITVTLPGTGQVVAPAAIAPTIPF